MKRKINQLLFIGFIMFTPNLLSQKTLNQASLDLAETLRQKYPETDAVIISSEVSVKFALNKNNVSVSEENSDRIISLRIGNEVKRSISYDTYSKISEARVLSEKGYTRSCIPVCGNYERDGIFHSDSKLCVYSLEYKYPGEMQTFTYKLETEDSRYYLRNFFQSNLPVQLSKITYTIPDWLEVELKEVNFEGYEIKKTVTKTSAGTVYEYTAGFLDEYKTESYSPEISHTYPHILVLAKSYKNKEGNKTAIISNTTDLYTWSSQLLGQLKNDNSTFKPLVDKLTSEAKTDNEKIQNIYNWVQDNIRYIAFENGIAGYKPAEASEVYRLKYGDCKGMANLTKWMLKTAGFDARCVWIGTNSIPYSCDLPTLAIFNHMICCVFLNGKKIYLDATEKHIATGDIAERIQGKRALIENGNSYIWDTIPVFPKERNLNQKILNLTIEGALLKGKYLQTYNGEAHQDILYMLNNIQSNKKGEFNEMLLTGFDKNISVDNVTSSDITDKEHPYKVESTVEIKNKVSVFENDFYVDLDINKDFENVKLSEKRHSNIYFNEKKYIKSIITLELKPGLSIKHLPEPLVVKNPYFAFSIKYVQDKNKITYQKEISINQSMIPKTETNNWNQAIKDLNEKYNDNLILTSK